MSAIAQGILTNFDYDLELLPSVSKFGTFGSDIYTTTSSWGMPMAITTTIRMIGFVTSVAPANPSDVFRMIIYNRSAGTSQTRNFSNWNTYELNSQALSTPLEITQGDLVYLELLLVGGAVTSNLNVPQVLAIYDLVTIPV